MALCPAPSADAAPAADAVRAVLGPLADRLVWTTTVAPDAWSTRAKGSVDRHAMTEALRTQFESASP